MKSIFKSFLTATLLVGAFASQAQVFQPVGNGINISKDYAYGVTHCVNGSDVYLGYVTYNSGWPRNYSSFISKWDGVKWVRLPKVPSPYLMSATVLNGDLYAAAGPNHYSTTKIYRFNGTSWSQVLSTLNGLVTDLEVFNGHLVCVGTFAESSTGGRNVVGFDGTNTISYPPTAVTDSLSDVNVINNELWITGSISHFTPNQDTAYVRKYDASAIKWVAPASKSSAGYGRRIFEFNSKIYQLNWFGISEIRNDSAVHIASGWFQDYEEFNGNLYLIENGVSLFDGTTVTAIANSPQGVSVLAATTSGLYGFFDDTIFNGLSYNRVFQTVASQFGLLSGKIFIDNNGDCQYTQATDLTASRMKLTAQGPSAATVITDNYGNYNVALVPGSYNFSSVTNLSPINKYLIPDPNCGNPSNVVIQNGGSSQTDFALTHDGTIDAETNFNSFFSYRARHGFKEYYQIKVKNPGAAISGPVDVEVSIPSTITMLSSAPSPTSSNGSVYTFSFNGLAEREEKVIDIEVRINTSTNAIGDQLCFYTEILGVQADAVPGNNKDTLCLNVVAACDPNDKRANVTESLPGINKLDYHIRFQNTGNDTAYNIVVVDTLESYFDPSSIQMQDASHNYTLRIENGSILVWTFNNVLLPDSTTNLKESQGYIMFDIKVDSTLPIGSVIDNDAEIYFDFQPPVHTNHAQTTIVQFVGLAEAEEVLFEVYPNPARDFLWVHNPGNSTLEVRLISITGAALHSQKIAARNKGQISVGHLKDGLYLLKAEGQTTKILIQH